MARAGNEKASSAHFSHINDGLRRRSWHGSPMRAFGDAGIANIESRNSTYAENRSHPFLGSQAFALFFGLHHIYSRYVAHTGMVGRKQGIDTVLLQPHSRT